MALGLLWLVRLPADSEAWVLGGGAGSSILPPADYFVDLLPALLVFGLGLIDDGRAADDRADDVGARARTAGVASAINNAISRVGSPLVNAVIFVAVASSFYATIGDRCPTPTRTRTQFRADVAPLNQPSEDVSPEIRAAARSASTDAFHLAVIVVGRPAVDRRRDQRRRASATPVPTDAGGGPGGEQPPGEGVGAGGPVRGSSEGFGSEGEPPRRPTGPARDV